MTEPLPRLKYPWFAYASGKSVTCCKCHQWIGEEEPRAWSAASKAVMHFDCLGVVEMGDHGQAHETTEPSRPIARASPEGETVNDRIDRMHAEKMAVLERIAKALEGM